MKKPILKTIDIEIALMSHFNIRANIIVPNVSWGIWDANNGLLHECDLIVLTNSNYATEIEIKVSKADLLKDKDKMHGHYSNHIRRLYFAVPEKFKSIALSEIPERAGLIIIQQRYIQSLAWPNKKWEWITRTEVVREPKINTRATKWSNEQRFKLARLGAMRILGLKIKINKLTNEH